jgi:DNA-binding beta-propeller fold protein YncE
MRRHWTGEGMRSSSFAGTGTPGFSGDGGPAAAARLNGPFDLAFDPSGGLVFADTFNHAIRRIDPHGTIATLAGAPVAGTGEAGFAGDGGPATAARLHEPYGIAIAADGRIFVVDRLNRRVRVIARGIIATLAGNGRAVADGDGGPAAAAGLAEPNDCCLDAGGTRLLIADVAAHVVRAVDLAGGGISTLAGTGEARHAGDGGPARLAALHGPRAVASAADGAILILERNGSTLRRIDPLSGHIATIAGTGVRGEAGDGGPATRAEFAAPKELAVCRDGAILIVDTETNRIRRIDRNGIVTTVASGLARPHGVAEGPGGTLFIGDTEHHRIALCQPGPA